MEEENSRTQNSRVAFLSASGSQTLLLERSDSDMQEQKWRVKINSVDLEASKPSVKPHQSKIVSIYLRLPVYNG
jgi:hypothetical protein